MFYLETTDGRTFHGRDVHWQDLPTDIVVTSLQLHVMTPMGSQIANHELKDFDAFGFQRYDHVFSSGPQRHSGGVQLLAKKKDIVVVVEVEFSTGKCSITSIHESACGYNPSLWRQGCSKP